MEITDEMVRKHSTMTSLRGELLVRGTKIKEYFKNKHNTTFEEYRKKLLENEPTIGEPVIGKYSLEPLDWEWIKANLKARCTIKSLLSKLGCSEQKLRDRCERELGITFNTLRENCRSEGEDMIVNVMFEKALAGNTNLLIWLSKNWLGYSDKGQLEDESDNNITINFNYGDEKS